MSQLCGSMPKLSRLFSNLCVQRLPQTSPQLCSCEDLCALCSNVDSLRVLLSKVLAMIYSPAGNLSLCHSKYLHQWLTNLIGSTKATINFPIFSYSKSFIDFRKVLLSLHGIWGVLLEKIIWFSTKNNIL